MPLQRIPGAMVSDSTITGNDVQDASLTGADLAAGAGQTLIVPTSSTLMTSGTFKDFTGIPSWAKRIRLLFNMVSTSGTSPVLVQVGVGSTPTTSGYTNGSSILSATGGVLSTTSTAGIPVYNDAGSFALMGGLQFDRFALSSNTWVASGTLTSGTSSIISAGSIQLSDTLGMLRITTVSGTPTFDGGFASLTWE